MGLGQKPGRELCCPDVWDPRWVISLSGPSLSPPGMGHLLSTASCRHERGSAGTARPGLRGQAEEMCSQPLSNSVQSSSQKEGTETARELTWREEALPGCTFHRPAGIRRKEGGCCLPSAWPPRLGQPLPADVPCHVLLRAPRDRTRASGAFCTGGQARTLASETSTSGSASPNLVSPLTPKTRVICCCVRAE